MQNKLKWQNTKLEPKESFEKGEYEELLKYVKENEAMLRSLFVNENFSDYDFTAKYGYSKMSYFEKFVEEKAPMFYALFKLGELQGYLDALGSIRYEEKLNSLALTKFVEFKTDNPSSSSLAESILKKLLNAEIVTVKSLETVLNIPKNSIQTALNNLLTEGFICCYYEGSSRERYSLTEDGIRVAKQLIKA